MTKEKWKLLNLKKESFLQFILSNVEDEGNWEVQKRLNQIEDLYWECFDHYE